jgi:hypothetical protein
MSKKRARIAERASGPPPPAGGGSAGDAKKNNKRAATTPTTPTTTTRSRKAIARANRRARPRDDYYEAEDAEAPDVHETKRFDVS